MRMLAGLMAALALSGCASLTRGTTEQIQFVSVPAGADVHTTILPVCDAECMQAQYGVAIAGPAAQPQVGPSCIAPCAATFSRKDILVVNFSKPGYEPVSVKLDPSLAKGGAVGMAGNIVAGGVTGILIDASSGATLDHCPNPVNVTLRKAGSREPPSIDQSCRAADVAAVEVDRLKSN